MSSDPFFRADVLIGRLRIIDARGDPVSARLRAARMLDADAFRPPGLPPSAILCIRTLRDPLPGQFSLAGSAVRPPANWSRALASRVETLARYARRPALDPLLDDAPAVLFLDPGELIACLAHDWLDGTATRRWWWQQWLRGDGVEAALLKLCEQHPIDVPAALDQLARSGEVVRFARLLSPLTIERLIANLLATFTLRDLHAALTDRVEEAPAAHEETQVVEPQAPWQRIAPESTDPALTPAARCLIGIGLTLTRAPMIARRQTYADAARRWVRHQIAPRSASAETARHTGANFAPLEMKVSAAPESAEPFDRLTVAAPPQSSKAAKPAASTEQAPETRETAPTSVNAIKPAPAAETSTPPAEAAAVPLPTSAEAIHTAYGGIFYLVNLALYLGLYGDASTPRQQGIDLPLWDFVALVGERLIGDALRDDPVWALLARLAGRAETDPPAKDFAPPDRWQMPADWLRAFPEPGIWRWDTSGGRLRIDHPAGFRAVDAPLDGQETVSASVRDLTKPYRNIIPFQLQRASLAPAVSGGLTRWLDWLVPYVDARLKRALNTEEPIALFLCRYPARIYAIGAHLDIVLSLQALPIEIRFAGLDRDPGWIPAVATIIRFHFE